MFVVYVHEQISIGTLTACMWSQKRKHVTIPLDPYAASKTPAPTNSNDIHPGNSSAIFSSFLLLHICCLYLFIYSISYQRHIYNIKHYKTNINKQRLANLRTNASTFFLAGMSLPNSHSRQLQIRPNEKPVVT